MQPTKGEPQGSPDVHYVNIMLDVQAMNAVGVRVQGIYWMTSATPQGRENERLLLGLLASVERDGTQSQRRMAADLEIALGLVNAYLKRCVKKGLIKVQSVPARRYAYYLTPQGFAEKSRLSVEYLAVSFAFFRQARSDCSEMLEQARARGWSRVTLAGISDLAEITAICAIESGVEITAIVDPTDQRTRFVGKPVFASFDAVKEPFGGILVTDLKTAGDTYRAAVERLGMERVLAPSLLGLPAAPYGSTAQ